MVIKSQYYSLLPPLLLMGFYLDLSVIVFFLIFLLAYWYFSSRDQEVAFTPLRAFWLSTLPLFVYPLVAFTLQVARLYNSSQELDFAIFSQVVFNFGTRNILETSLIDVQSHHFLTHHFSPYLYALGVVDKLVHVPEIFLILLHAAALGAIVIILFLIAFELDKELSLSALFTTSILLLPSVRSRLLWEARDEVFALPFLLAAYLFWLQRKHCE